MNGRSCFRTEEEKKEYNKERCKKYHQNNSQHIKEYNQTDEAKASQVARNKKYRESEHGKAKLQTPEAKAKQALANKKYRDKKKAETAL